MLVALTALDLLLASGIALAGLIVMAALVPLLMPPTTGMGGRTSALLASIGLALATALAMLRLIVAAIAWPVTGSPFVGMSLVTLPVLVLPTLWAWYTIGPRLRELAELGGSLREVRRSVPAAGIEPARDLG